MYKRQDQALASCFKEAAPPTSGQRNSERSVSCRAIKVASHGDGDYKEASPKKEWYLLSDFPLVTCVASVAVLPTRLARFVSPVDSGAASLT